MADDDHFPSLVLAKRHIFLATTVVAKLTAFSMQFGLHLRDLTTDQKPDMDSKK